MGWVNLITRVSDSANACDHRIAYHSKGTEGVAILIPEDREFIARMMIA
jgi:hypothetical protein